jgi:HK97 family phage major capsid protein
MSTSVLERVKPDQVPNMKLPELRSEIKSCYDQAKAIEDRYPDGLTRDTNHEDFEQVKGLLGLLDTMETRLAPLEEAEQRKARIARNAEDFAKPRTQHHHAQASEVLEQQWKSPGELFLTSNEYAYVKGQGLLNSNKNVVNLSVPMPGNTLMAAAGQKALVYSGTGVGGSLVANDVRPGFLNILTRELVVMDLIPRTATESDTIEYVREDTYTNNAAFTAEATATTGTSGVKPESALAFSTQTSPVKTLAHWIPVTNRMLSDAPALRGIINGRLLLGLDLALETQVLSGDGTGENLTGILNQAGINIQGMGADNPADALYKGRTQVMVTGLARPAAYVLHPNDWQAIRLMRENAATGTLGGYLMGPPSVAGPATLWGLPVIESLGISENTGLVGDFAMGCTLFDREDSQLRVGTINDQFVRNMQTILAELRCAFVCWRPSAFAKITGI